MKNFTVSTKDLRFGDRLVPSFYYYTKVIKEENRKNGVEYITLGEYSDISDGEHSHIARNRKGGIRYLYGRNIKEGIVDFDMISDDSYISSFDYHAFPRCHIKENDILIAIYGTVGKSAVYKSAYIGEAGIPRHIANISLKGNCPVSPEYLTAYFRSKAGKHQIFSLITGNIQQLLSLKNLREFEVPVIAQEVIHTITDNEKNAIECETQAQRLILQAQQNLYMGLNFDIRAVKREFSFGVQYSQLQESNIWSTNYYDTLYVKTAECLKKYNQAVQLREIVDTGNGDEVGSDNYKEFTQRENGDKPFIRTSDIVNWEADLYPDYYVSSDTLSDIKQSVRPGDVIFTKDGKIGCVGLITDADDVVLSSGIEILRVKSSAEKLNITPEYLFTALSIPEIGGYGSIRRTVVASTIPHLRVERLKDIEVPVIAADAMKEITKLVKEAFQFKASRKRLLKQNELILEKFF